jgi:hypothetical protein
MIALMREIGSWLTWMPRSSVNLLHGYGRMVVHTSHLQFFQKNYQKWLKLSENWFLDPNRQWQWQHDYRFCWIAQRIQTMTVLDLWVIWHTSKIIWRKSVNPFVTTTLQSPPSALLVGNGAGVPVCQGYGQLCWNDAAASAPMLRYLRTSHALRTVVLRTGMESDNLDDLASGNAIKHRTSE